MTITRFRKLLAATLTVLVVCTLGPAPMFTTHAARGVAIFTGHVLQPDGMTPQAGVTVVLVNGAAGERQTEFRSAPTDTDGSFRIDGAPAGTYALLVETSEGAFLALESLVLAPGVNPRQSLTLRDRAPDVMPGAGQSLAGVTWGQWIVAGVIVVAAAVAIKEVTDDVEEPASPF